MHTGASGGAGTWHLRLAVKEGQLEDFRALMNEMVEHTKTEAGAMAYEWFVSSDGSAVHICERYADSAAVMTHLGGFGEKFADRFFAAVDPTGFDVYGNSDQSVREALGGMGANFMTPFGGFAR